MDDNDILDYLSEYYGFDYMYEYYGFDGDSKAFMQKLIGNEITKRMLNV